LAGLGQATRYAAVLWLGPSLLLLAAMFAPAFSIWLRLPWILFVGLGGIIALTLAVDAAERAKRDRPSDLLLSATGLAVEGGSGRSFAWADVDAGSCEIIEDEPRLALRMLLLSWLTLRQVPWLIARVRVPVFRLRLPLKAGGDVLLAEAEGEERTSLEALRDSIRSAGAPPSETPSAPVAPEVLRCGNCGAPQVPVDQASAACPYCQHAVGMPEALRDKLRANAALRADDAASAQFVAQLIAQPGAKLASRWLALGRKLLVLSQPAALVYLCVVVYHQTKGQSATSGLFVARASPSDDWLFFYDIGVLLLTLVVAFWVVWSALSAYFANRQALRVLAESFGAVPPVTPGAPCTCRQCGAPLAEGAGTLVVRCVYCSAENVLGIDPRPAAARERRERTNLQAAARTRKLKRLRLAITVPVCAVLTVATVREAALLWWVPVQNSNSMCGGHCGTLENKDSVRRSLSLSDGTQAVRVTVLPRGTLFWECGADCTVTTNGQTLPATDPIGQPSLVISRGQLKALTGESP